MKLVFCVLMMTTIVTVIDTHASYLGYGGVVGDLTPRTGSKFYGPASTFRQGFPEYARQVGFFNPRVRREVFARPREARFNRGFGSSGGWRLNPGSGGSRGSYPRTAPASSSYGR